MKNCAPNLGKRLKKFEAPKRKIKKVYIHCSAASRKNIDANEIHLWHKRRGFSCIGYHYFMRSDAVIEQGRNIEKMPSAQKRHNWSTLAICVNGLHISDFSDMQLNELLDFCKEINSQIPGVTFHGHCEVSAKTCPVFGYNGVLGLDAKGRMVSGKAVAKVSKEAAKDMEDAKILIPKHVVKAWQKANGLYPDGVIGPLTWAKLEE